MAWRHQVSQEVAQRVVDILFEAIGCNINIMGEDGEIIATKQKERVGVRHEGGRRVMSGEAEYVSITSEMAANMKGVLPGYMGPVEVAGKRIACIGVTGEPEQVKPLQKLAAMIVTEELKKEELYKAKQVILSKVAAKIQDASASLQEVSAGAEDIADTSRNMQVMARKIDSNINDINKVVDLVGNIVKQTNLLGLNAAIEAARAGEYGRGFGIVAEEVRKLSADSDKSLKDIGKVLNEIKSSISTITEGIGQTAITTGEQAAALQLVGSSVVDIQDEVMGLVQDG